MTGITALLCVKNASATLRQCLESVSWADEIVVIDDCSVDDSPSIAREFGARVEVRRMERGFSEQRTYALSRCRGPWILSLDADDEITPELGREIREAVRKNAGGCAAFRAMRTTSYLGRWMRYCGWRIPVTVVFRKDAARYDGKQVHENLIIDGTVGMLRHQMRHHAYAALSEHFKRMDMYTTYDALTLRDRGVVLRPWTYPYYFFIKPVLAFARKYFLMQGYCEGVRGFFISAITAFVVFMNYAKLWELQCARDQAKRDS
jgi:glycosyltransferase involved in cell wall biosynthesis